MEWGWIIIYALGIFGAAGIAGGIVAFRGSDRPGVRSFAAASIAAGVVMWLVVLMVVPASVSSSGPGAPTVEGSRTVVESLGR